MGASYEYKLKVHNAIKNQPTREKIEKMAAELGVSFNTAMQAYISQDGK